MIDEQKLVDIFVETLDISKSDVNSELTYSKCEKWDSIAHIMLIESMENHFSISFKDDDIFLIDSFSKAKEVLSKYEV